MTDTVIKVENVSKCYRLGQYEKEDTFAGQLKNTLLYPVRNFRRIARLNKFNDAEHDPSIFWALQEINFEVKRGEVLGIIGKNGAGKSTLLKLLSKITEPTTGRIEMKGRVSALLEVGTGFHPELTGRDNVYMNGTILGMTRREINAKFEEIVEFAGVAKHIDTPVKFYSSGMKVRLGFSVAAHLEPEILIIDEVLAVGDFEFQKKCLGKMDDVANSGRTVLFVSHNMASVRTLCPKSILLKKGNLYLQGLTNEVISNYVSDNMQNKGVKWTSDLIAANDMSPSIEKIIIINKLMNPQVEFNNSEEIRIKIDLNIENWKERYRIVVDIIDILGMILFRSGHNDKVDIIQDKLQDGNDKISICMIIPSYLLNSGIYNVNVRIGDFLLQKWLFAVEDKLTFQVNFKLENNKINQNKSVGVLAPMLKWE